jgi:hypothetical protein
MKLAEHSRNRLLETFARWSVPKEFADPMYNYLVHGFEPGSCFTAVLANDFAGAIRRSHPANTVEALKALSGWIDDTVPSTARGSYQAVTAWIRMLPASRRKILEREHLVFTEEDEMMLVLSGARTQEPVLW